MWMRAALIIAIALQSSLPVSATAAGPKWQGQVPREARQPEKWKRLLEELSARGMLFGTMGAATRMLVFFTDLPSKQAAYQAVIGLADRNYPFSIQSVFLPGDITPAGEYDFVNSYNLYKSILNEERGSKKWAEHYIQGVDQEAFPKYLFYQAIQSYGAGELDSAEENLRKILAQDLGPTKAPFIRKVARTLARIRFDQKRYAESSEIYQELLLKTDPVTPSDWLEAAWNLYHLKRYSEALGMLYNLESRSAGSFVNLEKYTVRALIYRALCLVPSAEALIGSFDREFGKIIEAIKKGESISRFPELIRLEVPENQEFRQTSLTLAGLRAEGPAYRTLPADLKPLASYLYRSEIGMLERKRKGLKDAALERAARKLVMTGEHLKFLKFDVQREKFNADRVFQDLGSSDDGTEMVSSSSDGSYRIRWPQFGDYWRDERLRYQASLVNGCELK